MSFLLGYPFPESTFRVAESERGRIQHHGGVSFARHPVDKQIIISRTNAVMRDKPIIPVKERFGIREVAPHSHVGDTFERIGKVLHGDSGGIKPDELVQETGNPFIGTIAQHDLFLVTESRSHAPDPLITRRTAVGIGQQKPVIPR